MPPTRTLSDIYNSAEIADLPGVYICHLNLIRIAHVIARQDAHGIDRIADNVGCKNSNLGPQLS